MVISMGNNIDLVNLLGLPKEIECPRCSKLIYTGFDDYDIDCGDPEADLNGGELVLDCMCCNCDYEFGVQIKAVIVGIGNWNE